jgi:tRNA modification GTPase
LEILQEQIEQLKVGWCRMMEQDTIVAISTPVGRGGIGVVRLSGPRARDVVAPLLRLRHPLAAGRARFGQVLDLSDTTPGPSANTLDLGPRTSDPPPVLDECVVTYFAAPHSYTGEDVVEIAMHGSPVLLDYVLRHCCMAGARLADPGEFTQRAFLAGRIDLTQAEAVADLIGSSTLEQARVAARQLGGALAKLLAPIKEDLVALIAAMEAGIDFAEDDIDVLPAHRIAERIAAVRAPLQALEHSFAYGRVVRDGFKLAIVGRPNAGKSSLFNRLVQRERAIVTATPGTTRDLVTERVAIDGIPVELIDTAGLRESVDEAERMGIAKSHQAMVDADVVLLVLDAPAIAAAGAVPAQDAAILAGHTPGALLLASNKTDLLPNRLHKVALLTNLQSQSRRGDANLQPATCNLQLIETSALTGEGIAELRAAIVSAIAGPDGGLREAGMLTNLRQHQAVEQALRRLDAATAAIVQTIPHEMVLLDLYEALRRLDALTGATTTEDVLRLIFSTFCIGK